MRIIERQLEKAFEGVYYHLEYRFENGEPKMSRYTIQEPNNGERIITIIHVKPLVVKSSLRYKRSVWIALRAVEILSWFVDDDVKSELTLIESDLIKKM